MHSHHIVGGQVYQLRSNAYQGSWRHPLLWPLHAALGGEAYAILESGKLLEPTDSENINWITSTWPYPHGVSSDFVIRRTDSNESYRQTLVSILVVLTDPSCLTGLPTRDCCGRNLLTVGVTPPGYAVTRHYPL